MATPHTLDMATPGMARVCLHGDLQRFGRRFSLSIKTGAEAIYALAMQIPGFRQKMNDGWYQIRIAGLDVDETSLSARLHEPLPDGAIIHIVPRMAGAKSGGLFQVVLGAVAIGASFTAGKPRSVGIRVICRCYFGILGPVFYGGSDDAGRCGADADAAGKNPLVQADR
jgi:predicted phage tail protein